MPLRCRFARRIRASLTGMMMETDNSLQVLIVGAGPTGLALACDLARRGVRLSVIDKAGGYPTASRGKTISQRTMEVFDDLAVADRIVAAGLPSLTMRTYDGHRAIGETIANPGLPSSPEIPYPFPIFIPQYRTESILRAQLARYGIKIKLGQEVVAVEPGDADVTVTVQRQSSTETVRAEYVAGCDGGHSTIRRLMGQSFRYTPNETEKWCWVGDVLVDGLEPEVAYRWNQPRQGMLLLTPFKATDVWQFQFVPADNTTPLPRPNKSEFRRVWSRWTGRPAERLRDVRTASRFRLNEHIAERYRIDRVFLVGDAAHIYSPAGGQGMTTGIQDAYNLGWKIAAVLRGAPSGLLDTYEAERKPVAEYAMRRSRERWAEVNESIAKQGDWPMLRLVINEDTSQLKISYRGGPLAPSDPSVGTTLRPGDRAPDGTYRSAGSGDPVRLFDVFRGPHWTVLLFGTGLHHRNLPINLWGSAVRYQSILDWSGSYAFTDNSAVVVRPDGYIARITHPDKLTDDSALLVRTS